MSFYDNGVLMATVALEEIDSYGWAQLSTSSLTAGSHTITAVYSGDQTYAEATTWVEMNVYP